jgi:hypothetical protein
MESSSNPPVLLAALPLLHGGWRTTPSTPHPLKMVQRACKSSREGLLAASLVPFWHARTKTLLQEAAKPGDNASTWPSASGSGSPPTLIETNQRVCGPRLASAMRCKCFCEAKASTRGPDQHGIRICSLCSSPPFRIILPSCSLQSQRCTVVDALAIASGPHPLRAIFLPKMRNCSPVEPVRFL